jgi:hypothetical protein
MTPQEEKAWGQCPDCEELADLCPSPPWSKKVQKKMSEAFNIPYTNLRTTYQEMMAFQCQQLALYLLGDIQEYCPVSVK